MPVRRSRVQAMPCEFEDIEIAGVSASSRKSRNVDYTEQLDISRQTRVDVRLTCFPKTFVTAPQLSLKYCSLYLGKRTAKLLSSVNGPETLSASVKGSIFQ